MDETKKPWISTEEKIIIRNSGEGNIQVVFCDECPCENYLIAVRCDLSWEGIPECSCNPVDVFRYKVSIIKAMIDENRNIWIFPDENQRYKLGQIIEDEAYGHVYHSIDESDDNPQLYASYESAEKAISEVTIPDDMEYDPNFPAYYTYWGLKGIEACPCPCKYARVLACGTLEDESKENIPYDLFNWPRQIYVTRIAELQDRSVWIENPLCSINCEAPTETGFTRKWLKDCTEYPAEEVYGSNHLYNPRYSSEKRKRIKLVQLSPAFETEEEAEEWGAEWSVHQWAILLCSTCECRCLQGCLVCIPAGYRVNATYHATIIQQMVFPNSSEETTNIYDGHNVQPGEVYLHPGCNGISSQIMITFPQYLENGDPAFPVESTYKYHSSQSGDNESSETMAQDDVVVTAGNTDDDCERILPPFIDHLPGLTDGNSWPKNKNPFYQDNSATESYNYMDYWQLPSFNQKRPWVEGSWTMNYNESETSSFDTGTYTITTTVTRQASLQITITPFFDEEHQDHPPVSAVGCGSAESTSSTASPLLISANYRKFYNQLSEDLK